MGFICPDISNQGNWDPGTATELCLSPATGGNHLVHMCIDIYTLISRPSCSTKEGSRMRLLVVSVFV